MGISIADMRWQTDSGFIMKAIVCLPFFFSSGKRRLFLHIKMPYSIAFPRQ